MERFALDRGMSSPTQDEIFRPRKRTWALVLLVSAVFAGGGFWFTSHPGAPDDKFWGYGCTVFFGLGVLVALIQFIPGSSFLRLGADGFTICTMWRTAFYRWDDIERFGVAGSPGNHMVGFNFSATSPHRDKARTLRSINRALTGFEGALPDNYGWDCAELAAHLNRLREQYLSLRGAPRAA